MSPTENPSSAPGAPDRQVPVWERAVLEELALSTIREQRSRRRWSIFFRLLTVALLLGGAALVYQAVRGFGEDTSASDPHTALINIDGVIDADGDAGSERIVAALQAAYGDKGTRAVVLRINSPGGSPVQSGIIYDEINRLRSAHNDKPVYAVIEDLGASGAYYIAAAADQIYVNRASLVGSIGVIMEGFGATEAMQKLGIERRVIKAGDNKALLDPFQPQSPAQVAHVTQMVNEIHQQFITAVRQGRGDRLRETPDMFSGLVWTGARSVELGLADGLGTVDSVARELVQADTIVDYTVRDSVAERFAKRVGVAFGAGALKAALQGTSLR
jgi:protease-4